MWLGFRHTMTGGGGRPTSRCTVSHGHERRLADALCYDAELYVGMPVSNGGVQPRCSAAPLSGMPTQKHAVCVER